MTWHGQINRTIWEIEERLEKEPNNHKLRAELVRTHFLQRYEYDRSLHIPRDDRSFLFLQERDAPAMLLLHGAHGTPAELRELGNFLYSKGFTVFCPRLSRYDLKDRLVSWESWVTMAETGLTTMLQYTSRTSVTGLSLGGTVAIILQRLHPIHSMVLLAPALYMRMGLKARFYATLRHVTPTLFYRFAGWNGEAIKAMDHVRKSTDKIDIPALAIQARDDHLVSSRSLSLLKKWGSNEFSDTVLLARGSHAITRGEAKGEVMDRIWEFLQRVETVQKPDIPKKRQPRSRSRRRGRGRGGRVDAQVSQDGQRSERDGQRSERDGQRSERDGARRGEGGRPGGGRDRQGRSGDRRRRRSRGGSPRSGAERSGQSRGGQSGGRDRGGQSGAQAPDRKGHGESGAQAPDRKGHGESGAQAPDTKKGGQNGRVEDQSGNEP